MVTTARKVSPTLQEIGGMAALKLPSRRDRAFLLAKICSEKGKALSARACAKVAVSESMSKKDYATAESTAKQHGLEEEGQIAAGKLVERELRFGTGSISVEGLSGKYGLTKERIMEIGKKVLNELRAESTANDLGQVNAIIRTCKIFGFSAELEEASVEAFAIALCVYGLSSIARLSRQHGLEGEQLEKGELRAAEKHVLMGEAARARSLLKHVGLQGKMKEVVGRVVVSLARAGNYEPAEKLSREYGLSDYTEALSEIRASVPG